MEEIVGFLGFASLESIFWNSLGYGAFIGITVGVLVERHRKWLLFVGALLLALYAGIFLENILLATLQAIITVSCILQLSNAKRPISMTTLSFLAIVAFGILLHTGNLDDIWALLGSFGLLSLVTGIVLLPEPVGFIVMACGGLLLILYSYTVEAWVFFGLNIFFVLANMKTWYALTRQKGNSPQHSSS